MCMNRKLRTIVVEDERLPRLTLLQKLEALSDKVEVVDDCDSYEAALASITTRRPDLVLLDIQLRGRDSIQLLNELQQQMTLPYVIFTTAYDNPNFLLNAIKLQAVDYLLKPISRDELAAAIDKVLQRLPADEQRSEAQGQGVSAGEKQSMLMFRTSTGRSWVDTDRIAYVKAARNYSVLVCFDHEEVVLDNLMTLEAMLAPKGFARVDRSTLVNSGKMTQLNVRRPSCRFRSADGVEIELELSKVAGEHLKNYKQ